PEAPPAQPWDRTGWGFGGLPAANYNSDEGAGFGVVGSVYRYDGHTRPYKTAVNAVVFVTTQAVHTHSLELDALELGHKPVRLTIRGEFASTGTSNYCGIGPEVTCDEGQAEAAADASGLTGEAREDFVRRYYRTRFLNPNAQVNVRWALDPLPHKVELVFGYRANGIVPGDFSDRAPWPGSLYAQDYPGGEAGLVSALQVGVMVDDRDVEPAPTRGYWAEATVRGASFLLGSDWDFVGANVTLRGYVPVGTARLVLADRVMFDVLAGDAPTLELSSPGGTQRYTFYGSLNAGRGIRLRRYIGALKSMNQTELRWTFARVTVAAVDFDLAALGFVDLGFVGAEAGDFAEAYSHPLPSTGGGLRIAVDRNFVVRADVGVSPLEGWAPAVYIDLKNVF
ncbi:MAG: BamA/TamA family outer membrane protein, partial [Myxococcota bacterium]